MNFCGGIWFFGFNDLEIITAVFIGEMFWRKVVVGLAENLIHGLSDCLTKLLICKNEPTLKVLSDNILRN